jgi:rhodanese-related sulfurtransferase
MRTNMVKRSLAGIFLVVAMAISGCGGSAGPASAPVGQAVAETEALGLPVNIDAATLNQVRNRDDVVVLDVREDYEFAGGHIPGATWIPLGELSSRLNEIPAGKTVVAVCRSGNRSGQATTLLRQQGFDAHNMQGGMISWEQAGYDVEK